MWPPFQAAFFIRGAVCHPEARRKNKPESKAC
jgi:hypothetical protein